MQFKRGRGAQAMASNMNPHLKRVMARRIISRVSKAYGTMMLKEGLFQADAHPGNILIMRGGRELPARAPGSCTLPCRMALGPWGYPVPSDAWRSWVPVALWVPEYP